MSKAKKKSKGSKRLSRKQLITALIVAGVLIVAAGVGVLVRWLQNQSQNNENAEIIGLLNNPLPQDVNEAKDLGGQGNYNESNKVIEESLQSAADDEKYELYLQQGLNYENQGQYDKALEAYRNAEKIKQTYGLYESMGRAAEAKGDKQLAIDSYKKAIQMINPDDPVAGMDKRMLEDKIKALWGTP